MPAKGDGLAVRVASIGVTAVAAPELDERQMTGLDFHAAERRPVDPSERRGMPQELQRPEIVRPPSYLEQRQPDLCVRQLAGLLLRETHPPRPPKGGAA